MSLSLAEGQSLALLGRNGMGKTTLVNTIIGVTRYFGGTHHARRPRHHRLRPDQRAHAGIGWVPQERNIFKSLTVEENLTAVAQPGPWTVDKIYACSRGSPSAKATSATSCPAASSRCWRSAARSMLNPRIMLLDEPLEGLAPIIVDELLAALRRIIREEGLSAILVEQNAKKILGVTDRAIIIERGCMVHEGDSAALLADRAMLETRLGVTDSGPRRVARGKQ